MVVWLRLHKNMKALADRLAACKYLLGVKMGRNMRVTLSSTTALVMVSSTVLGVSPALADSGADSGAPDQEQSVKESSVGPREVADAISEILVTARRRKERLHDVPVTVNVIDGNTLDRENITTLRDVVEHSPQVSYQETGDIRTDTLSIHGLSSVSNVAGV